MQSEVLSGEEEEEKADSVGAIVGSKLYEKMKEETWRRKGETWRRETKRENLELAGRDRREKTCRKGQKRENLHKGTKRENWNKWRTERS